MLQQQRLCSCGGIERMARLPARGEPDRPERQIQRKRCRQKREQLLIPLPPSTAIAPTQPEGIARLGLQPHEGLAKPTIVVGPNWIAAAAQHRRARRATAKQIHHLQRAKPPVPRKAQQAPQGGIVVLRIRPRRVQADKQQPRPVWLPGALERPAIEAAGAEQGVGVGVLQSERELLRGDHPSSLMPPPAFTHP